MSNFQLDYDFDILHPNALMLCLKNVTVHNQATSWRAPSTWAILALLPGYVGTGVYGVCQDAPYLQSSALPLVSHGDDLRTRRNLEFKILSTGTLADGSVKTFLPTFSEDWSASLVFWTIEPEGPLTPYNYFHIWIDSNDRTLGTTNDCVVPVDLTTFNMYSRQEGDWNAAVSYISPIFHNVPVGSVLQGLMLTCDNFRSSRSNQPVLAYLNRTHVEGEERYYGRRHSVKGVTSDTLGVPLCEPIDNLSSLRLRLLDVVSQAAPLNANQLVDYVACRKKARKKSLTKMWGVTVLWVKNRGGGGGDRSPSGHPLVLFSQLGLAATIARSGAEGGAGAVGVQRSHLFGAVLKDADQAVLGEGAKGVQEGLD